MESSKELDFDIVEEVATLSESGTWKKQLNIVRWGDNIAKYDIRAWNADHTRSGKGVTFTIEELKKLKKALLDLDDI